MYADNEREVREMLTQAAEASGLRPIDAGKFAGELIREKLVYDKQDLDLLRENDLKLGPAGWIVAADGRGAVVAPVWMDVVTVLVAALGFAVAIHAPTPLEKATGILTSIFALGKIAKTISEQEAALLCELAGHQRNSRVAAIVAVDGANMRLAGRALIQHPIKPMIDDLKKKGARIEHFGMGTTAELEFNDFVLKIK